MPVNKPYWLDVVAAAQKAGADNWSDRGVAVHRLTGGYNNALYRVEVDGEGYACKLCVVDERRRAAREYGALRLLQAVGLDIAPRPLWLDESCEILPLPALVYHWLPGDSLGLAPAQEQLAALLETLQQMHALRRHDGRGQGLPTAWFHWFDFGPYLSELGEFVREYGGWLATTPPDGADLRDRLARLVDCCAEVLTSAGVDISPEGVPLCLCHVDQNLANAVWGPDHKLRWVDWEFAGWGDPALDLAELRWHAALDGLSPAQHAWLRTHYLRPAGDDGFEVRLAAWDYLIATRWPFLVLRMLWSLSRSNFHVRSDGFSRQTSAKAVTTSQNLDLLSLSNGPDRLRLIQPEYDPAELRARMVRFIERAERFLYSIPTCR